MRHLSRLRWPYGYLSPILGHERPPRFERVRNRSCGHPVGIRVRVLTDRYTLIWRRCEVPS